MQNKITFLRALLFVLLLGNFTSHAGDTDKKLSWPIEIESEGGFVTTLYQPQLESFEANILEGRMAVTIKPKDKEMIFGAVWFNARMSTDLENRTVVLEKMDIIKTHFPDMMDEEKISKFSKLLSAEMESWNLEMSLDRILSSLNEIENLKQLSDKINNEPPAIYFRTTPAVMVMIDGDPILKKDEDSGLEYVVNTPFFIVKDTKKGTYYINGGPFWYTSKDILSGWEETKKPPSTVKKFAEKYTEGKESDSVAQSYTEAPKLIVETKAAELVQVDGEIDYKPIDSTTLLYVSNTESDIIMDINSQNHYLLLAGRWYYSKTLKDGDWKFSEPDELPAEFKKIPKDSEMTSVRSGIPGTSEAQTALLEQSIPQTATIDRKTATVEVKYDGNPKFEKIEGTDISYAVNTDKTVLLIKNTYYAIEDAVWFMSDKATGPWKVCVDRPDEVDQIPPESPVYNVKYTYIYESTPEVVYVGYLPGYTYSYVYGGVVVYGTGYYYRPWYGSYYYPRPVTWGYGVHYSPYGGWGFSVGISYGWIGWGFHPYRRAYWGPRGYHRGYRHGYNRGYRHGYNRGYSRGARAGYAAGSRNSNRNVYNNRSNGVKQTGNVRNAQASNNMNNKARASGKSNNMYSDKKGNVYQRDQKGNYQNKSNRQQSSSSQQVKQSQNRSTKGTTQQRSQGSSSISSQQKQNLNRSHQSRSSGTQNYNRSSSSGYGGASRSSMGGSRGGGGGGRRR
ncbi:MAG: sulfur globule family protein [Bacteroidales bacterium]|nr:sulfur globule family protein [Bacteroidales bacterium]